MAKQKELLFKNYMMALGRIGLALVIVPILVLLAVMFAMDEDGSKVIAAILLLGCLPFLWIAFTVPVSVQIGDSISVRYLLARTAYPKSEIAQVRFGSIGTQFGLGRLLPGWELGVGEYRIVKITTKSGRSISVKVNPELVESLQKHLGIVIT